jgi:uncharacterized protein (TIGR03000 family)
MLAVLMVLGLSLECLPAASADGHEYASQRWSPAATDCQGLLRNDCAPACYPGIYAPGWSGWWYMYFGHSYSPYYSPRLHDMPFHHYTHPFFNFPIETPWSTKEPIVTSRSAAAPGVVSTAAPAKVIVTLPADATLLVNGQLTELASGRRVFTTPELPPGKDDWYVIRSEVTRGGQVRVETHEVAVRAGRESRVTFPLADGVTARK